MRAPACIAMITEWFGPFSWHASVARCEQGVLRGTRPWRRLVVCQLTPVSSMKKHWCFDSQCLTRQFAWSACSSTVPTLDMSAESPNHVLTKAFRRSRDRAIVAGPGMGAPLFRLRDSASVCLMKKQSVEMEQCSVGKAERTRCRISCRYKSYSSRSSWRINGP